MALLNLKSVLRQAHSIIEYVKSYVHKLAKDQITEIECLSPNLSMGSQSPHRVNTITHMCMYRYLLYGTRSLLCAHLLLQGPHVVVIVFPDRLSISQHLPHDGAAQLTLDLCTVSKLCTCVCVEIM